MSKYQQSIEFVTTLKTFNIYKRVSPVSGETVYAVHAVNEAPTIGNRLFGGSYFGSIEEIKSIIKSLNKG